MRVKKHILRDDSDTPVTFVASPNTSGGLNGGRPKFLVIHYTAGRNASGAVRFFERSSSNVSAHLVIDHDGDITQMLPLRPGRVACGQKPLAGYQRAEPALGGDRNCELGKTESSG